MGSLINIILQSSALLPSALMNHIMNILILLSLAAELCFGGSRGYYRRRNHENGRRYQGRKYHHRSHSHDLYEYYEPTYERVYERDYDQQHNEEIDYSDIGQGRVA